MADPIERKSGVIILIYVSMKNSCFFRFSLFLCFCWFAPTLSGFAQIVVSTLAGNDANGSLIAAIKAANAQKTDAGKPVTISFAKNLSGEIVLSMDLPAIENHISFAGNLSNGNPTITINGSVDPSVNNGIMGGISPGFSLFVVKQGRTVAFENLHLTKSNKSGIYNDGGTVTVKNCLFTYNVGIGSEQGAAGAIHSENGLLTVIGSYFFYNTGGVGGTDGGVGYGGAGGITIVKGNAVVINSSFIENEGGFGGVGVGSVAGAGAIMVQDGNFSLSNSTVAGNFGGGSIVTGASGGIVIIKGNMLIAQSTIVDNQGGAGLGGFDGISFCSGGIHVLSGKLSISGNIIAGNLNGEDEATDIEAQQSGEVHSTGNNLLGKAKVQIEGKADVNNIVLSNIIATTSEGTYKTEVLSGFLPTISLTANSPAKNQGATVTHFNPVESSDANAGFFTDAWKKYGTLLQADQNGKKRTEKPSIGSIE